MALGKLKCSQALTDAHRRSQAVFRGSQGSSLGHSYRYSESPGNVTGFTSTTGNIAKRSVSVSKRLNGRNDTLTHIQATRRSQTLTGVLRGSQGSSLGHGYRVSRNRRGRGRRGTKGLGMGEGDFSIREISLSITIISKSSS